MFLLYLICETNMLMLCTAGLHVQVQPMWSEWYGMLQIND